MSSNQDSTEPWDCISRISEDTPSLSSSWQDLGERPEEPESQTAETEGNQQSHEADTESDVGGVRGPQVQSNHIQNPFRNVVENQLPAAGRTLRGDSIAIATQKVIIAFGLPKGSVTSRLQIFIMDSVWKLMAADIAVSFLLSMCWSS
ncbi:uncharacterized protein FOBCDRAFT_257697 [Fusarium oxysporum Fo47]|uniref:uncharacterized protein n=1 Tax=Fusarium oxysporum Fo47 TaxID=660027 RepID=UPI0028698833|nr:uncharacterized protein FOBCDRAFT_257697 [Fusarium oxysporum Fo47]QKD50209.2 hypothetical protein FOBCDRAFT_257697 [Fusarium oxysporum Fo47]